MSGKILIDDETWRDVKDFSNDELLRIIKENQYDFKYIALPKDRKNYFNIELNEYEEHQMNYFVHIPSTLYQYELLISMANADNPTFFIVHSLYETHSPYINPISLDYGVIDDFAIIDCENREIENKCEQQVKNSYSYFDEQLDYYRDFYKEYLRYEILFSDHGRFKPFGNKQLEPRQHTFMIILGKDIKPRKIESMQSLTVFPKIVKNMFNDVTDLIGTEYDKDYILVQVDDCYSNKTLDLLKEKLVSCREYTKWNYFQYRCIRTKTDAYIRFACGDEYYEIKGVEGNQIDNPDCKERINKLRQDNGCKFINTFTEPKYESGKKIYELLGHVFPETNQYC